MTHLRMMKDLGLSQPVPKKCIRASEKINQLPNNI